MINIKVKVEGMNQLASAINPKIYNRAVFRTLNKIGDQAKTAASNKIRETYNVKVQRLKDNIKTSKAYDAKTVYTITTKGKTPGLQYYDAKQSGKGLLRKTTVLVRKDRGKKVVTAGFMAATPQGQMAIWKRTGEPKRLTTKGRYAGTKIKREPIKRLLGPSVVGMMNQVGVEEIEKTVAERADRIWAAQLDYELNKKG